MTKGKRLVWLEELPKEKYMNPQIMKEICDGKTLENEIMYGTSESINVMFKMFALSNHIPKIDPNESAVYNRYKQISFNSHFDRSGDRKEPIVEELKFIADATLPNKVKTTMYNEVFSLIIDYANKFYKREKKLPTVPQQFLNDTKETQAVNDDFGLWFDEHCVYSEGDRVPLKLLAYKSQNKEGIIKEGMARKGFKYNKDLSKMGKDLGGKNYKGGFENVKMIVEETDEELE
jgi:phage/plasmid-associated DNA primase